MNRYDEQLDNVAAQMKIAHAALEAAAGILGEHLDALVGEIHTLEKGNIKEPMHVLHWRTGLRALHSLGEAQDDLTAAIYVYTKNR